MTGRCPRIIKVNFLHADFSNLKLDEYLHTYKKNNRPWRPIGL
jgi:hypothetical protein